MSSLKIQRLDSKNRRSVSKLVFEVHMRSVPSTFNFLKLRPLALIVWTTIATAIFKYRNTPLNSYIEIMTILSGSVTLTQILLFVVLLYEASSTASGPKVVGKLDQFMDADQQDQDKSQSREATESVSAEDVSVGTIRKRTGEQSSLSSSSSSASSTAKAMGVANSVNKDNQFWVLGKGSEEIIGCIGAEVDKVKNEARLVSWAVQPTQVRQGAGTLLLKTAMDQLSGLTCNSNNNKKEKVDKVIVVLQGSQVPALRLFHKYGFVQLDRTPEWTGERVVLQKLTSDWTKEQK
ncbi:hypothetical protein BG011_006856 [Mortierella polycephala]|uniref:N-acetyltransferase domain-containing protein n=1 Tax=Mortierella polycephala TaxID=41804 RepID=A0A9P6PTY2_9FUNG|nr:hypothetical protein BG011_006856 [Mortierella polycephala]